MLETHVSSSARTGSCVVAFTFTTTGWSFPAERFSNAAKSEVSFWKGRQDALARSCGRLDSNVSLRSPTTSDGRSATRAARGSQLQPADVILCTDESPECCGVVDVGPLTCPPSVTLIIHCTPRVQFYTEPSAQTARRGPRRRHRRLCLDRTAHMLALDPRSSHAHRSIPRSGSAALAPPAPSCIPPALVPPAPRPPLMPAMPGQELPCARASPAHGRLRPVPPPRPRFPATARGCAAYGSPGRVATSSVRPRPRAGAANARSSTRKGQQRSGMAG